MRFILLLVLTFATGLVSADVLDVGTGPMFEEAPALICTLPDTDPQEVLPEPIYSSYDPPTIVKQSGDYLRPSELTLDDLAFDYVDPVFEVGWQLS